MQLIGIDKTAITAATAMAAFRLGTIGAYDDLTYGTQELIYGRAAAAITGAGYVCVESTGTKFQMATTANTAAGTFGNGTRVGVAQAAMALNEYGWFLVRGKGSVRTAASAAIGTRLNTTAVAGVVDDDAGVGARAINGIVIGTATGGAEATNADATVANATVGITL